MQGVGPEVLITRTRLWAVMAAACFFALAGRLGWVQVVKHSYYEAKAKKAIGRTWPIPAPRGKILDRNGIPLALNLKLYTVAADPTLLKDLPTAAKRLAPVLRVPEEEVLQQLTEEHLDKQGRPRKARFVRLRDDVDEPVADAVTALKLPGLVISPCWKRAYPHGSVGAALLGFVGKDPNSRAGIEARFNQTLAGEPGEMFVMLDGRLPRSRTQIPGRSAILKEMRPGESVVLTIDLTLQRFADEMLAEAVQKANAKGGAAVVMDPKTGEVLALANQPTFDPNQYQDSQPSSWVCQAVTSPYEPGSTFKSITACAALEEGLFAHGETISCGGSKPVGNRTIHCAQHGGSSAHGVVDLHKMIVKSCNVGLGTVGLALGPTRLHQWIKKMGFGARTGIELTGETAGLLSGSQNWSQIQTANIGFGQGVSVTPIQLLAAYSTIANGGYRVHPHVVKMVTRDGRGQPIAPPKQERVLSAATCATMRRFLQDVVEQGTGTAARIPGRTVGGKTGTAQKAINGTYPPGKFVGSFVGFAPVTDPKLAVIVTIDEPKTGHYGGVVAAPAFQRIMEKGLAYLHVPPDAELAAKPGASATKGSMAE